MGVRRPALKVALVEEALEVVERLALEKLGHVVHARTFVAPHVQQAVSHRVLETAKIVALGIVMHIVMVDVLGYVLRLQMEIPHRHPVVVAVEARATRAVEDVMDVAQCVKMIVQVPAE